MTGTFTRIAQPGDYFVLLEPASSERVTMRQRQAALQQHYGGQLHQRIHVTCQRFELPPGMSTAQLTAALGAFTAAFRPFPIIATDLTTHYSPFWRSHLLRWQVEATEEVCQFVENLENRLEALGISPHFTHKTWKTSAHVTALEQITTTETDASGRHFPEVLFHAQKVVLSRILIAESYSFDIIDQFALR